MPRTARAAVGGICYHVINRGNGRMKVFNSDQDHRTPRHSHRFLGKKGDILLY